MVDIEGFEKIFKVDREVFNVDIDMFEFPYKVDDQFVFGRFYIPQKDRLKQKHYKTFKNEMVWKASKCYRKKMSAS